MMKLLQFVLGCLLLCAGVGIFYTGLGALRINQHDQWALFMVFYSVVPAIIAVAAIVSSLDDLRGK